MIAGNLTHKEILNIQKNNSNLNETKDETKNVKEKEKKQNLEYKGDFRTRKFKTQQSLIQIFLSPLFNVIKEICEELNCISEECENFIWYVSID